MKRLLQIIFLLYIMMPGVYAQEYSPSKSALEGMLGLKNLLNVRGTVYDSQSLQTLPGAQVKLAKMDGTLVAGGVTNEKGQFLLQQVPADTYRVNISFVGYKAQNFSLTLPKRNGNFKVNDVLLKEDAVMMAETVVEGKLPEMVVVDDTVMYNADAFVLPEGAVVEDLIKKLPGIMIDDDGNYIFNGKKVSQFLVDGKEFFGGNRELILKNLPADIVDKVKAYDKKSDRARITGIDDGEEETVLDLIIKKNKKHGVFGNLQGGYGLPKNRYQARMNLNRFKGEDKYSLAGNANNSGGNGLTDAQSVGVTMNKVKGKLLDLNGSLTGNFSQSRSQSWSNSQNFELSSPKYNNSHNWSSNRNNGMNFQYKVEWKPDSTWNILFRPDFSLSKNRGSNDSESAQFSQDPYAYTNDPLGQWQWLAEEKRIGINHRRNNGSNENKRINANGSLQINKRLSEEGRNVTLNLGGGYSNGTTESGNYNQVDYLRTRAYQDFLDGKTVHLEDIDSLVYNKVQFNRNPSKNYNVSAQLGYSEPLGNQVYLQLNYSVNYRFTDNQRNIRSIYPYQRDAEGNTYYPFQSQFNPMGLVNLQNYEDFYGSSFVEDDTLQLGYTTNHYVNQEMRVQVRVNKTKYQLTVGGNVQPQYNKVDNVRGKAINLHTSRWVWNASPNVNFRYKFSRQETLNFRYNGNSGQPNITDMVAGVLSDNDPLNIRLGNPDLKPSFTHNINADYRRTQVEKQMTHALNAQFRLTQNSTANKTEYNEQTGGRVSQPVNVNGNWSGSASYNFSTALDAQKHWRIANDLSGNFNNNIGYQYNSREHETLRTKTNSYRINERLRLTYRHDWETGWQLEATGGGQARYDINRSTNPNARNLNIWNLGGAFNTQITFPWGMQFATDVTVNARRGYADKEANITRTIWNASLNQRFFRKKFLTVSLRWVDILSQRDDLNRSVGATNITDSHSEMVSSYVMLSVNLRFGFFGGQKVRDQIRSGVR